MPIKNVNTGFSCDVFDKQFKFIISNAFNQTESNAWLNRLNLSELVGKCSDLLVAHVKLFNT